MTAVLGSLGTGQKQCGHSQISTCRYLEGNVQVILDSKRTAVCLFASSLSTVANRIRTRFARQAALGLEKTVTFSGNRWPLTDPAHRYRNSFLE